jgi:hypothetical protein
MKHISLSSNRSKGQNGYLCPVVAYSGKLETEKNRYPRPIAGQGNNAHRGKFYEGEVRTDDLPDGWYFWKEAILHSTKMQSGLIKIKDGEIILNLETIDEMLVHECEERFPSMGELEGSEKQISWATTIRAKALLLLWEQGYEGHLIPPGVIPTSSKFWIEDGDKRIKTIIDESRKDG